MGKLFKFVLSFALVLVLVLIVSSFSEVSSAQRLTEQEEKEVEELAEKLKFVFEEATLKDINGQIISIDINKIEEKYGSIPELEQLKEEIERAKNIGKSGSTVTLYSNNPAANQCLKDKIANGFTEIISANTYSTILTWLWDGEYTLAAKKLISIGVKGNAAGVAGTLLWYMTTCLAAHPKN